MKNIKNHLNKLLLIFAIGCSFGQNPIIRNQFSADPSARVFGDRVYVFPSHDILATKDRGREGWFCMEDYHVFSSDDLTDWTDHGTIVQQNKVPWVKPDSYSMWAPDCIERNGKYYFYFPSTPKDSIIDGRGFTIGVAIADKPEGSYTPEPLPIAGVRGIDPNVFIDKDGQAYLYWSAGNIFAAKLKNNMLELDSEVKTLGELPAKGLKEGPYVFERNGIYYLTYPHVENKTERLEYAISDNPLGPFKVTGVIMDESPTGCWTNHHSIINFKGQRYLFYHHNDYSPSFDKARSVRVDKLNFNTDGTIQKVIPTLRGVGITKATDDIQIDRYSNKSEQGVSIAFLDTLNTFKGWKTVFNKSNGWVQYNNVDFGKKHLKSIIVKAKSENGGTLEIRGNAANGTVIAEVNIPKSTDWKEIKVPLTKFDSNNLNLFAISKNDNEIEIDWIKFE
ncbi:family 43 glycosylhydrolase [Tenacibaculum sp.]|uniref:family 43 glycosylhydrolase n=1 Tax=Tenacibaculum sp. TaxID=1906242 RepID=UPI003D0AEB23